MQIIVLGMHRSGTSAVSRIMNMMGAYFGPEGSALDANEFNPKGYWERRDILNMNDALLRSAGSIWCRVAGFTVDKVTSEARDEFKLRVSRLLLDLDAHRPWVIKDPRLSLLLDLWRPYLEVPICVLVYRHPVEVARSLKNRDLFPLHVGVALWEKYNLAAMQSVSRLPLVFLSYQELMARPVETVKKLHDSLQDAGAHGLRMPGEKEITSFIIPSLHRQRGESHDIAQHVNYQQREIFSWLENKTLPDRLPHLSGGALEVLQNFEEQFDCQLRLEKLAKIATYENPLTLDKQLSEACFALENMIAANDGKMRETQQQLALRTGELRDLSQRLQETQQQLSLRSDELSNCYQRLEENEQQLALRTDELHGLQSQLADCAAKKATLRQEAAAQRQHLQKLIAYFEQLHRYAEIIFCSFTWRTGFVLAEIIRRITRRRPEILVQQRVAQVAEEFVSWKKRYLAGENVQQETSQYPDKQKKHVKVTLRREVKAVDPDATVSVVIPTLNAGNDFMTLLPTLKSQQGLKDLEIVVVDSGSADETVELARNYGCKVVEILPKDFSHSYARNLGAENATGNYLLFMTQDALPPNCWWIYDMLHALKNNDVVAASCAETPRVDADLFYRISSWNHYKFLGVENGDRIFVKPNKEDYETLRKNAQLSDIACIIRADIFKKYKFRNDYAEDLDLGLRLINGGYKLTFLSSIKVIHSHNRPAFYHLKRAYVDNLTLARTFPAFKTPQVKVDLFPRDIVYAYLTIESLATATFSKQHLPCTVAELSAVVHEKFKNARSCCYPDVVGIHHDNPHLDSEFVAYLQDVAKLYSGGGKTYDGFLVNAMNGFFGGAVEFLRNAYEIIDEQILEEVASCLYKAFAYQAGAYLAYCYLTSSEQDRTAINGLVKDLARGV